MHSCTANAINAMEPQQIWVFSLGTVSLMIGSMTANTGDGELELGPLYKVRILQDCPSQVQGARRTLPNAPGKLQSGMSTQRAHEG